MLHISPISNTRYILLKNFVTEYVVVPKGYKTNGADVPSVFSMFFDRYDPEFIEAVVVHDYLWTLGDYSYANKAFCNMLNNSIKSKVMCLGVKLYAWYKNLIKD